MVATIRFLVVLVVSLLIGSGSVAAQEKYGPGVTDTEIKIGQTQPYSGPASSYGTVGKAEAAYFQMINDQGGVNGRKINLISLDDGYSPPKTVEQVRRLIEQERVLLLFNNLGTPTNTAIHKYVNAQRVPHILLATGATKWGDRNTIPGRSDSSPITRPKRGSTPDTFCRPNPARRLPSSIRTMTTGRTS